MEPTLVTASSRSSPSGKRTPSGGHCPPVVTDEKAVTTTDRQFVECAVFREGPLFIATCLDLGLVVQRPNADEALHELFVVVQSYVRDAHEEGLTWKQTLRPLPWRLRREIYRKVTWGMFEQWLAALIHSSFDHSRVRYCSFQIPATC